MTGKSTFLDQKIQDYIQRTTLREEPLLRELREETARMPNARMQIGPEQGQFMRLLAKAIGARSYLEIGVFTGYSALSMALALPEDGQIVACDVSEEYTTVARRYWERAGVAGRIDLRLGPALDSLDRMLERGERDRFDMAFVDADKANVEGYYERALSLLRRGGLLLVDNVLWGGDVADPGIDDEDTHALRALTRKAQEDERVDLSLVPICDGILIARKR
jgi:caffeoyl-CoA O-methyltransferase